MPTRIKWLASYSVNNETIDKQHKYLFDLCNTLYKLVENPVTSQSEKQALLGLQDYIEIHFTDEEKHYVDHPMYASHHELHEDFIKHINGYLADYEEGNLQIKELADFTRDWLVNHITVIDSQYFRDIAKSG
ncbi:MAG: hypothetical protein DSY80_10370 [Desulfocapsa sp.]|nr:MAG: hypothetical protein DSY80_10370 [Desulfocapsa sp.]